MLVNKAKDITELSASLQGLFALKNWSSVWQTYLLTREWPEIVGGNVAKKSEPAYIQKHTLWVFVQSSVLMQHLQAQKPQMLERIHALFPGAGIEDIRWEMQPAPRPAETEGVARKRKPDTDPEADNAFESMAATVENKKCRDALKKLWRMHHAP